MAEYVRGDMLLDPGPLCQSLELQGHRPASEGRLVLRDEDRHLIGNRFCRIIVLPFCQGLAGHDERTGACRS